MLAVWQNSSLSVPNGCCGRACLWMQSQAESGPFWDCIRFIERC